MAQALPEAGIVLKFIYDAVVTIVGEPDIGVANNSVDSLETNPMYVRVGQCLMKTDG